jgi:bacterioferritin
MKKVNQKVIDLLLDVYWAEIGAVGIYMEQHTRCSDMGYHKLAEMLKKDAIHEMKHAEDLSERILFLGGTVINRSHSVPVEGQSDITQILKRNIDIEVEAIKRLNDGVKICFTESDNGSRMLLEEILKSEEEHLDELRTIYDNVKKYKEQYIVTHLM